MRIATNFSSPFSIAKNAQLPSIARQLGVSISQGCIRPEDERSWHHPDELKSRPAHIHKVLGGDITADPLPLTADDHLTIYERSYK